MNTKKGLIVNPERYISEKKMTKDVLEKAFKDALIKIDKLWEDVHGNFPMPTSIKGVYGEGANPPEREVGWANWHQGFWTGILWLAYEVTGDEKYCERALSHISSFYERIDKKLVVNHHDMGFLYIPSCVAAYKLCGNEKAKEAALKAADAVTAKAVDNVENESVHESDKLAFTLKAELQRARFPYHGNFKAGDGAVLTITTGGYADKVVVRFPEELLALNPDLDQEYVYEYPEAMKTEIYMFNIPLDTPSGSYTIEVEAWKNGRKLTEELELPVRTVGSIIEEFRTRIRDNGV